VARALASANPRACLLDPFGGSGTTALAAALRGFDSAYCEVNPYLGWVAETKVNRSRMAAADVQLPGLGRLAEALDSGCPLPAVPDHPLLESDRRRGFFPPGVARTAVCLLELVDQAFGDPVRQLARLAVSTSLIPASNMIRRTDLRKRRAGDPAPVPLRSQVASQLRLIYADVRSTGPDLQGCTRWVASDARQMAVNPGGYDLIVTSPPYLNGTNYCRNTKLELLALGLIEGESELSALRLNSIAAGINNVSKRRALPDSFGMVEELAEKLDAVAYDSRLSAMVRLYFSDMSKVFARVRESAAPGARWLLDIGDSKFAGVHIPTPDLLASIAAAEGWALAGTEKLRSRRSYDGSELTQVLLDLRAE
jgi:hypothetical protein